MKSKLFMAALIGLCITTAQAAEWTETTKGTRQATQNLNSRGTALKTLKDFRTLEVGDTVLINAPDARVRVITYVTETDGKGHVKLRYQGGEVAYPEFVIRLKSNNGRDIITSLVYPDGSEVIAEAFTYRQHKANL
ncbi:MAG: hypothetical protein SFY92_12405 [Verrucomicrobiae bacterium]|nr:hypothetical protein [Verrucomicrobiae bacterium]